MRRRASPLFATLPSNWRRRRLPPSPAAEVAGESRDGHDRRARACVRCRPLRCVPIPRGGRRERERGSWIWASGSPFRARLGRLTRQAAEVGEGCGAPGRARKLFEEIPFRPGPTLRAIVIQERPAIGPVRTSPVLAPDGRAGPTKPGPGTPASPQACRPPRPFVVSVNGPGRHRMTRSRLRMEPPPTIASRSTAPQGREGRRPYALPIALKWAEYAGGLKGGG